MKNHIIGIMIRPLNAHFLFVLVVLASLLILGIPSFGQITTGSSGLINIPEGELYPDKTFIVGANYLPVGQAGDKFNYDTGNYYFNLTFLPFIEATYRLTFFKKNGEISQQDRAFGLKYRVLKEKARRPSLLVGMDDVYSQTKSSKGNQYFASNFICASKTFQTASHWFRLTAGYGFNTKGRERLDGFFGGVNYSPKCFTPLSLKAEYDTKRINFTGSLLIVRHICIYAGCFGKDKLAAGFAWRFLLD